MVEGGSAVEGLIGRLRASRGGGRDDTPVTTGAAVDRVRHRLDRHGQQLVQRASSDPAARLGLETYVRGVLLRDGLGGEDTGRQAAAVVAELAGLGPLEALARDPEVTEILVNGPFQVYVERRGRLEPVDAAFDDAEHLLATIQRLIAPTGRRLDAARPFVDARLADGSRLHAVIPPIAPHGPLLTIRRFPQRRLSVRDLLAAGLCPPRVLAWLVQAVRRRRNLLISGATSSGKTTLLGALASLVPRRERIVTLEEALELQIRHPHVVSLETRLPNHEGRGEVTLRDLVRNALRMRPDRIIIGEVRGAEAFDLVQALNTGHAGSLSTIHANSARDALTRFAAMILMAPDRVPYDLAHRLVAATIDGVVHLERDVTGRRVAEVLARDASGEGYTTVYRREGGAAAGA
nr:hypothetical protein [Bacillota bacterium]